MFSWINDLIDRLPGFLQGPFRAVAGFFIAPWRMLDRFFRFARIACMFLYRAANGFRIALTNWMVAAANALYDIVFVIIPKRIRVAVETLTRWVNRGLSIVWHSAIDAVKRLTGYALQWIADLRKFIQNVFNWATARVNAILDWINRVATRVVDLVLHPDKLAAWILPALWGPLWRFLESRAEPIGRWLLGRALAATLRNAALVERVIARIF